MAGMIEIAVAIVVASGVGGPYTHLTLAATAQVSLSRVVSHGRHSGGNLRLSRGGARRRARGYGW